MTDLEILEQLKKIFALVMHNDANFDEENPANINLKDLGVNSIGLVYFAIAIEETFGIDMSDVSFNTFKTVEDVVVYIKAKI